MSVENQPVELARLVIPRLQGSKAFDVEWRGKTFLISDASDVLLGVGGKDPFPEDLTACSLSECEEGDSWNWAVTQL